MVGVGAGSCRGGVAYPWLRWDGVGHAQEEWGGSCRGVAMLVIHDVT